MPLSNDLISQFVKVTKSDKKTDKETIAYGTVARIDREDPNDESSEISMVWVRLDGAGQSDLTPLSRTTDVSLDDRVIVMIKNHSAVITGNITSPSARTEYVKVVETKVIASDSKVTELDTLVADKVSTEDLYAEAANIKSLVASEARINEMIANGLTVDDLKADAAAIEELEADIAEIDTVVAKKIDADTVASTYATIADLDATNLTVTNLSGEVATFKQTTTDTLAANEAAISDLKTDKLDATEAAMIYANIDFSNIGEAAVNKIFSETGLISDLTVRDGTITGKLVGVTISGGLIEGNTIKADKLVVLGSDGIYYKLNFYAGATTSTEVTESDLQNGLHGTAIIAKTITAEKISVDDLVAFGATIGGFKITDNAIHSAVKESVDNATRGIYLDNDGQLNVGDSNNYIKYYKDENGDYKLEISAGSILLGAEDVATNVDAAKTTADEAHAKIDEANTLLAQLSNSISTLVTDGNGTSLMTQTDDGWTFSTADIQSSVNGISESLSALTEEVGSVNGTVDVLQQAVVDLGVLAEYVKIGTYEDEPCIELGEGDSNFKLLITNTRIMFMDGSDVPAYINNKSLYIKKAVIEEELHQGGYAWVTRSNGHLSLIWKGATS